MRGDGFTGAVGVNHLTLNGVTLTNVYWNGNPETGVRRPGASFSLVQHGWHNWGAATVTILSRLAKGWDTERIADFMQETKPHKLRPFKSGRA